MEDQSVNKCHLILTGLAMRYKLLSNAERQIVAFLIPGDLCPADGFVLEKMDHSVGGITAATCAEISATMMRTLLRPMSEVFWWGTMTDSPRLVSD